MSDRIPGLDGLRTVSIGLVLGLHTSLILRTRPLSLDFFCLGSNADGVEVFFVISGFIITLLLLREFEARRSISLKRFYARRAFRILPPLYAYIIFLAILSLMGRLASLTKGDFLSSALFFRDYNEFHSPWLHGTWPLDHTWSLSVEEQFYLFWPLLLGWLLHKGKRATAAKIAVALILVSPLIRIATHFSHSPLFYHRLEFMLHTRVDALMFGCLTALTVNSAVFERIYKAAARAWWLLPIWILFITTTLTVYLGSLYLFTIGYTLNGICISLFMVWCTRNPQHVVGKVLNNPVIVHLGVLSYGIYIWQQLFFNSRTPFPFNNLWYSLLCVILVAEASHQLIEKPSNWFRGKVLSKRPKVSGLPTQSIAGQHEARADASTQ